MNMTALEALRAFWDKGITLVSPEALGMTIDGRLRDVDFAKRLVEMWPSRLEWDGVWIVLRSRP